MCTNQRLYPNCSQARRVNPLPNSMRSFVHDNVNNHHMSSSPGIVSMRIRQSPIRAPPPPNGSRFEDMLAYYHIRQAYVSDALKHLTPRLYHRYNLRPMSDTTSPTIFIGLYHSADITQFHKHTPGKRFMRPGGNDVRTAAVLYRLRDAPPIFAVSRDIQARLHKHNTPSTYVRWDIVNRRLFRPIAPSQMGRKVYVYNGPSKCEVDNMRKRAYMVYGQSFVDEVARLRPQYELVQSNQHGWQPYERMPEIYAQCCIGLRLTKHDGTANMVQELAAMGIPVVHNQSEYGLKWRTIQDVIGHIDKAMGISLRRKDTSQTTDKVVSKKPAIVISSTQYPGYGGAATNAYELIKTFRAAGYNTAGVFFHNVSDVDADPDSIGGIRVYPYKYDTVVVYRDTCEYLGSAPTLCLAKNYLAPQFCKQIFRCRTVYLVSGINHFRLYFPEKTGTEVLDSAFQLSEDQVFANEVKTLEMVDVAINNSKISNDIFRKFYPQFLHKIRDGYVDTTASVLKVPMQEKKYDIVIACSILTRKDKNNMFLLDLLKSPDFSDATKIIVGENGDEFSKLPNATATGILPHTDCVRILSQSRILLFPSKFDSNSNTVREAYKHGCLPLITHNTGYSELFPSFLICSGFDLQEWNQRLKYLLLNYDHLKDIHIPFGEHIDPSELIK